MTITATEVRHITDAGSDRILFRLSSPVFYGWSDDDERPVTEHVIVSAINNAWAHETYIFPADAAGEIIDWVEMSGSYRGDTDHYRAIREAGWVLA